MLTLNCRLNKNDALVFTDIIVTPFLSLAKADRRALDQLFIAGHLVDGTYYLAAYPSKGPRAVMKIGFVDDLGVYAEDVARGKAAEAVFFEPATGSVGDVLDLIAARRGSRRKVAEVWWFHSSPQAEHEWHAFMETFAHQVNEQFFFAPVMPPAKVARIDFRKPPGSDLVTMTIPV